MPKRKRNNVDHVEVILDAYGNFGNEHWEATARFPDDEQWHWEADSLPEIMFSITRDLQAAEHNDGRTRD